jgi:hypothetical protein
MTAPLKSRPNPACLLAARTAVRVAELRAAGEAVEWEHGRA